MPSSLPRCDRSQSGQKWPNADTLSLASFRSNRLSDATSALQDRTVGAPKGGLSKSLVHARRRGQVRLAATLGCGPAWMHFSATGANDILPRKSMLHRKSLGG